MSRNDALLAGLPRGGTTLSCELLNRVANTVALDEPLSGSALRGAPAPGADAARTCEEIERFLRQTRSSALTRGRAISRQVGGKVLGAKIADARDSDGKRVRLASREEIQLPAPLSDDFLLVIKHNAVFAALLDRLSVRYRVYAIVRNPLAILCSWQAMPFQIRIGHAPLAEAHDSGLRQRLEAMEAPLDRQLELLRWWFGRLLTLPRERVLRYEDIVASQGRALAAIAEGATDLSVPLGDRNPLYEEELRRRLGERLLEADGPYWDVYTRDEVAELAAL